MNSRPFLPAKSSRELADSLVSLQSDTFGALLAAAGGLLWLGVVLYIVRFDDFWPGWGTLDLMLALIGICFALKGRSYHLAAGLFVAELLAGIYVFVPAAERQPLVLSLFAPVVLIAGTLLGSRAAFLTALAASLAVGSAEPLLGASISPSLAAAALGLIWLTALTSWAATRNLYTALGWAWENNEEAERNLAEAREYQAKLVAALRQLEEANYRLERANYALTWARAEADQARRLKAQFAAHVSHELRTPINLVVGFAELMLNNPETYDRVPLPKPYLADLTAIHRSATHLRGLIDDILDISQIDAGEMPVLKDLTDVGAIVHEAVATARQLLERKGLTINVEIAPDLPLLHLDRLRIRQVLLNLLNNAARFTERGSVSIRAYRQAQEVIVEVADTGVGIRPDDLAKLFEPFHQLESSPTRGRGGTGLGLAISKRFVELHGGRIWAKSEGIVGRGSTFGFALPLEPEDDLPSTVAAADLSPRWGLPTQPPTPTVVVLDDDPAIVSLLQRHLEGYQVASAAHEGEAVEVARSRRAHAIVTDLPDAEDLGAWHQRWSRVAAQGSVRVLGCPLPSGRRVARTLGLVDYLVKPVTREALLESVQAVAPGARTILVVDDDPRMVRLLGRMLRSSSPDRQLLRAYDGQQALDLMRRSVPDLVLLDLLMPQVDGLTVLERMRADPALRGVPVIAVSARGAVEAILPSTARTLVLVSDEALPVSQLLRSVRAALDSLPPAEAKNRSSEREPVARRSASGAF